MTEVKKSGRGVDEMTLNTVTSGWASFLGGCDVDGDLVVV